MDVVVGDFGRSNAHRRRQRIGVAGVERSSVAHSSGSPALIRASRNPGSPSINGRRASSHATENLGFNFIASASAAFASGALSAAA